jgi:outer membrane protein OmpA-like peptidoglycan-associated protein
MIGSRIAPKRRIRDEAERPFWISFADLMTALMVLFLVVMGVALLAVTKNVSEREKREEQHRQEIEAVLERFSQAARRYDGIEVDKQRRVIDFGDRARFPFGRSTLTPEQESLLRQFVPEIIALADDGLGRHVLKRLVVEGYTDSTGTYLGNLNLSLQRSERVLCALFASTGPNPLSLEQKEAVRSLFLIGGYSSNAARDSADASRRVEMRLEFLGLGERRAPSQVDPGNFGECALR